MNTRETLATLPEMKSHNLIDEFAKPGVKYEKHPAKTPATAL